MNGWRSKRLTAPLKLTTADAWTRYQRNGYDWDMHGTLYTPEKETDPRRAFVFFHGGAGSEKIMDLTPDGRPGLARVLAAQGFKVLALTYPGHYPLGGVWKQPIAERNPIYLKDRDLPARGNLGPQLEMHLQRHPAGRRAADRRALRRTRNHRLRSFHGRTDGRASHALFKEDESHRHRRLRQRRSRRLAARMEKSNRRGKVHRKTDRSRLTAFAGFVQGIGLRRSGGFDALGRRRRLHSSHQPAALADENQSLRQPAQCRRRHSRRISQAHRPAARGIFRSFAGARSQLAERRSACCSQSEKTTKATGSKATSSKTNARCSWAPSTPRRLAERTWF